MMPMTPDLAFGDTAATDLASPDLAIDFGGLDQKLSGTRDVDSAADYPTIPDPVRYDLAIDPAFSSAADLKGFLFGLQDDVRALANSQMMDPEEEQFANFQYQLPGQSFDVLANQGRGLTNISEGRSAAPDDFKSQRFLPPGSALNDVRRGMAGLGGKQSAGVFSADAPTQWKNEAFERGLLTADQLNSRHWSPTLYKQVNYEMMSQQLTETMGGTRTGAISAGVGQAHIDGEEQGMMGLFDKWLSPSGLIATAVAMDFLPDFTAIQRESQEWGNKWRTWWDNPTSARDFIDAATGPLDDILFPVLNTALLFSGVGQVAVGFRLGVTAGRFAQMGRSATMLGKVGSGGGKVARAMGMAEGTVQSGLNIMKEQSLMAMGASKMGSWGAPGGKLAAKGMDGWRKFHSVQQAKLATRGGMRLGLAGNVETFILPERKGGHGLVRGAGTAEAQAAAREWRIDPLTPQGAIAMAAEVMFQPSRIFLPGTITNSVKGVGRVARRSVEYGEASNLFDKQVGRLEYARGYSDQAQAMQTNLRAVGNREELTGGFADWWHARMLDRDAQQALNKLEPGKRGLAAAMLLTDAAEIEKFAVKMDNPKALDDAKKKAGEFMLYVVGGGAVDAATMRKAMLLGVHNDQEAFLQLRRSQMALITPARGQILHGVTYGKLAELQEQITKGSSKYLTKDKARHAAEAELDEYAAEFRLFAEEDLGYKYLDDLDGAEISRARMEAGEDPLPSTAFEGEQNAVNIKEIKAREIKAITDQFADPLRADDAIESMSKHIKDHEAQRQFHFEQVLADYDVTHLSSYLDDLVDGDADVFKHWDEFMEVDDVLSSGQLSLDDIHQRPVAENIGQQASVRSPEMQKRLEEMGELSFEDGRFSMSEPLMRDLSEEIRKLPLPKWAKKMGVPSHMVDGYRKPITHLQSSTLTAVRRDTPVKQDLDAIALIAGQLRRIHERVTLTPQYRQYSAKLRQAAEDFELGTFDDLSPADVEAGFANWSDDSVVKFMASKGYKELGLTGTNREQRKFVKALRWIDEAGGDMDDPGAWVAKMEQDLLGSDFVKKLKFSEPKDIAELEKSLAQLRKTTASEMAFVAGSKGAEDIEAFLAARGYKLARGVSFTSLNDMRSLNGPFAMIRQSSMNRRSLGRFFSKMTELDKMKIRERNFRILMADKMAKVKPNWTVYDSDALLRELTDAVRSNRDDLEKALTEDAQGIARRFTGRLQMSMSARTAFDYGFKEGDIAKFLPELDFETLQAVKGSLIQARKLGWEKNGLQDIENILIEQPMLKKILRTFDATEAGRDPIERGRMAAILKGDERFKTGWDDFAGAKRAAIMAGGALAGGAMSERLGGEWYEGALFGAGAAAIPGAGSAVGKKLMASGSSKTINFGASLKRYGDYNPFSTRTLARGVTGYVGGTIGNNIAPEDDGQQSGAIIAGTVLGAFGTPGMFRAGAKAYDLSQPAVLAATGGKLGGRDYSRLGSSMLQTRDFLRFTINPWFDAQRYSEAIVMGATKDWGDRALHLPFNYSPSKSRKMLKQGKFNTDVLEDALEQSIDVNNPKAFESQMGAALNDASGGRMNPDLMEATTKRFTDEGVLGFSNHRWQTWAATHLISQGMPLKEAAAKVQDLYSYGRAGRSAAELSANFVFFPFSYMKKFTTQVGTYLTDDLSRAIILHDGLKAYETLDENFDLQGKMEAHLPVLKELRTLNPLAYGLSPGQLGGINRPLLDVAYNTPMGDAARDIANVFLPQALLLETPEQHSQAEDLMFRAVPAIRQAQRLLESLKDQGNVATSPSHTSKSVEIDRGMEELSELREQFSGYAESQGMTLDQVMRTKESGFSGQQGSRIILKRQYKNRERQISQRYPAMVAARSEWVSKRIARDSELKQIVDRPNPAGLSRVEQAVWTFDPLVKQFRSDMEAAGLGEGDEDFYPDDLLGEIRRVAVALAAEEPSFGSWYNIYWASEFGPIERDI